MRDDQARAREPVAVVGMAALCPGDPTTEGFLSVMMEGRDQIRDVPPSRFSLEDFHAPDPSERGDRTYCTRGAFIDPVPFDPMAFGIPPSVIAATDSAQLLTLLKAHELMEDSGIDRWGEAARERVGVILGAQGMTHLQGLMMSRIHWPAWVEELRAAGMPEAEARAMAARINGRQPGWQEMSFPGFLGNITAGRVTNRLDLGGTNYVVDAACASSLSAISAALNELYLGQCDAVITGGCDLLTDAGTFLSFANSTALSKSGDCRPFSADADGTVIGEGVALLALRRLADAERDGDAIHAVIRGHGTASDGRGSAIYAPRSEGQVRAMERAYEAAGYGAETVGLIEAHGTGTGLGDATEVRSMSKVFGGPGRRRRAALGSVKSLIGHPKTSAGAVSLLKVVTALRHGVLPPTIKVGTPNEALAAEGCPVHPNTVARPWIAGDEPRRAGLSAFGFGGTNAHVTVEEYRGPHRAARRLPLPAQLLLFSGGSRADVLGAASEAAERVGRGASLDGVARASQGAFDPGAAARLALVARAAAGLSATLVKVTALLERTGALPPGLDGAAYAEGPAEPGRVAFLFPGQGSQRVGMAGELAMHFEAARAPWDADDAAAREAGEVPLHEVAFPDPALSEDDARAQEERLRATEMAQPALALATLSHLALTEALGLRPDLSLGHSFGEVMALHAAGAFDGPTAVRIARERGRLMREAGRGAEGAMTSLSLPAEEVEALIARSGGEVRIANRNAPRQVVVSGLATEVERLEALCPAEARRRLPVSTAFHSPVVADAAPRFAAFLEAVWTEPPAGTVLADLTAAPYPEGIDACRETLASQIAEPVLFEGAVRAAFEAGARTFVEVGPGSVLSRLAAQCLEGEPAEAVPLGGSGVAGFLGGLARLAVRGVALRWDALSEDRRVGSAEPPPPLKPHVVWVDSTMLRRTEAERLAGVEPRIVGAAPGGRIEAAHAAASPRDGAAGGGRPELDRGAAHPDPDMGRLNGAEQSAAADPPANGARPPFDHASLPRPDGSAPRAAQERTFRGGEDAEPTRLVAGQDPSGGMDIGPAWTAAQRVRSDGAPVSAGRPGEGWGEDAVPAAPPAAAPGAEALLSEVSAVQERFLAVMAQSHEAFLRMASAALGAGAPAAGDRADAAIRPTADRDMSDPAPPVEPRPAARAKRVPPPPPEPASAARPEEPARAAEPEARPGEVASAPGAAAGPDGAPRPPAASDDGSTVPEAADPETLAAVVTAVIADKTGYPEDMLEDAMELEADLGVDSIRRVEILMALEERVPGLGGPEAVGPEAVAALRTIGDVAAFLQDVAGGGGAARGTGGDSRAPRRSDPSSPAGSAPGGGETPGPTGVSLPAEAAREPARGTDPSSPPEAPPPSAGGSGIGAAPALPGSSSPSPSSGAVSAEARSPAGPASARTGSAPRPENAGPGSVTGAGDDPAGAAGGAWPRGPAPGPSEAGDEEAGGPGGAAGGAEEADPAEVLLAVVADATGYPTDMLEMDMELEADLGVDSIKRMEILLALGERLPGRLPALEEADMAAVADLSTLADVVAHLREAGPRPDEPAAARASIAPDADATPEPRSDAEGPALFVPVLAPAPAIGPPGAGSEAPVRIAPDDRGVAEALVRALRGRGVAAEIAGGPPPPGSRVVLLGALRSGDRDAAAREALHREAFEAIRAVGPTGAVIAVEDAGRPEGLGAMVLTAAKEWPDVGAKSIRLEAAPPEAAAAALAAEIAEGGPEPEIVLGGGARRVPVLRGAERATSRGPAAVDGRSVVVVSGGARGVAAACAEALARRHAPRLVLLGRTPLAPEPAHLAGVEGEAGLKAALLAHARAEGQATEPAEVGRAAAAVLAAREARGWIARIEAAGSEVIHAAVDVRDAAALARVLDEARGRWGPITGVVHAAGVIADRRIEDKTPERFAEVFATKVAGFEALLRATAKDPLRLVVAFSSVAARFGSAGQIDYAAANAVLGAMARREAEARGEDCLVRAIEWGPWEGGMVSPALARHMRAAGLALIDPEAGARVFCDLVDDPGLGGVETVVTDAANLPLLGWPRLEAPLARAAE